MESIEKMYQLYKEGKSFRTIAKEFGCSHSTVSRYLKKYTGERGLDFSKNTYEKYSAEEIYQLYKEGKTFKAIAREVGCSCNTVSRYLKEYTNERGLDFSKNTYEKYSAEEVYRLYKEGKTFRAISREIGCSCNTVSRYLEEYTNERGLDFSINAYEKYSAEEVYQLYKEGKSFRTISKEIGCAHSTVSRYLKKYTSERGLDFSKNTYEKYSAERMYQLYKEGKSFRAIAKEFGCDHNLVSRYLKKYTSERGLDFSIDANIDVSNTLPMEEIFRYYSLGISSVDIGKMYNCSSQKVMKYLREYILENNIDYEIIGRNSAKKKYYIAFLRQIKEIINDEEKKNKTRSR